MCLIAGGTLIGARPSAAHPYGSNDGAAAFISYGGPITNLIGNANVPIVEGLNVPTSCGARFTSQSGCTVVGANARPMQIGATAPQSAVTRGEFLGYGYFAGCAAEPVGCAGTAGGNYREMRYFDGVNSAGNYIGTDLGVFTVGSTYALKMLRYGQWHFYINNNLEYSTLTMSMTMGIGSLGSESTSGTLLMDQVSAGWQFSQNGGFGDVGQIVETEPHSPSCVVDSFQPSTGYGSVLTVEGSC